MRLLLDRERDKSTIIAARLHAHVTHCGPADGPRQQCPLRVKKRTGRTKRRPRSHFAGNIAIASTSYKVPGRTSCGAGRGRSCVYVLVSHLAVQRNVSADIDYVVVEFDQMLETRADRG